MAIDDFTKETVQGNIRINLGSCFLIEVFSKCNPQGE